MSRVCAFVMQQSLQMIPHVSFHLLDKLRLEGA